MKKVLSVLLLVCSLAVSAAFAGGPPLQRHSSNCAAEWGVDFCEQFDGLADWDPTPCLASVNKECGNEMANFPTEFARMPKLANGNESAWTYFSVWNTIAAPTPFVGSETDSGRKIWRGTKSAIVDIGESNRGPSRLGLYLGDWRNVQADDGYKDLRVFYMVNIPPNNWPTHCQLDGGVINTDCGTGVPVGIYQPGSPYAYYPSWKFNTFNVDCNGAQCPVSNTYGNHTIVPQIKQYNGSPNGVLIMHYDGINDEIAYATEGGSALNDRLSNWFGVEFRVRVLPGGTTYGISIWVYDQLGNMSHVLSEKVYPLDVDSLDGYWDSFFFGGNNANSWIFGPTMQSHYYVDDFIVDDGSKGLIGPRYFAAVANDLPQPLAPPNNISNWTREALQ